MSMHVSVVDPWKQDIKKPKKVNFKLYFFRKQNGIFASNNKRNLWYILSFIQTMKTQLFKKNKEYKATINH